MDHRKLADEILGKVGGEENVASLGHCATRLRFNLKDDNKANADALKNTNGVVGVVNKGGQFQVVIGNDVKKVYRNIIGNTRIEDSSNKQETKNEKKGIVSRVLDTIAGSFFPIIPAIAGAGMLKAVLALLQAFNWVNVDSNTYQVLLFISDAAFYFLPVLLAASAAKKFNVNQYVAMSIGAVLIHPTFISLMNTAKTDGSSLDLVGVTIPLVSYASSVIPIILAIWFMSYIEPLAERIIPASLHIVFVPLLTLIIVAPITLIILGPLGNYVGIALGEGINFLNMYVGWLVPLLIGTFTPFLVMAGMHYGIIPIGMNMLATKGIDTVAGPGMLISNIAEGGATLAVALRAKNKNLKQLAASAGATAIVGITEPAMYGISLRFKRPLWATMIGGGAGGLFIGIMGVGRYAQVSPGIFSLPSYIGPDGFSNLINIVIGICISFIVAFIVSYILGIKEDPIQESADDKTEAKQTEEEIAATADQLTLYAPITGKVIALSDVDDAVFAEGILGQGAAIIPSEGKVLAPADGVVTALFDTNHAIGITTDDGAEILIHVGIDTVKLGGLHYTPRVEKGQTVKQGDLLLEFDIEGIKKEGYDIVTPFIITNSADFGDISSVTEREISAGERILEIIK
ncbi:PTS beta-glucoside transporter subunit EIIBCA [Terribacillus saccharophilus]|uniref:PTS beta-glucoside transporter subunit EIIBCA n=1 Tax=Terribacillus saccharophilus TaxID=361277 RepID=A0A268HCH7_9BACI|nr:beta-glucoside-specific PTS transporter subunit IIABC [Terribacillus saccharophilus]PAE07565.1 PTS beta-glucoside transporter subunit EIIBCA [Terribacillus saccharophilus]